MVLPQVLEVQPNGTGAYRLIRIQQVILVGILDRHGEEAVEEGYAAIITRPAKISSNLSNRAIGEAIPYMIIITLIIIDCATLVISNEATHSNAK